VYANATEAGRMGSIPVRFNPEDLKNGNCDLTSLVLTDGRRVQKKLTLSKQSRLCYKVTEMSSADQTWLSKEAQMEYNESQPNVQVLSSCLEDRGLTNDFWL